jgi:hypothetical protein
MRRYFSDNVMYGKFYGTARAAAAIHKAVEEKRITIVTRVSLESERLDIIAGKSYKNSNLWWIIAAASGIGWGLQVPAGTVLRIPTNLDQVRVLVG